MAGVDYFEINSREVTHELEHEILKDSEALRPNHWMAMIQSTNKLLRSMDYYLNFRL